MAAAEHVDLSQPTLGRRLAAMEKRIGVTLFVRGPRRMQVTDAGRAILDNARRIQREMMAIDRALDVQSRGLSGEVTITATEGIGTEWLAPELLAFYHQYPEIVLNIYVANRTIDLEQREADIALRLGRPTEPDLIARRLLDLHFGLYAATSYVQGRPAIRSIEDLSEHEAIGLAHEGHTARLGFGTSILPDDSARVVFATNSAAAQVSAAKAGYGIAVQGNRWAAMYPELTRILPELTVSTSELWLVTHEELKHSARIKALADFLFDRLHTNRTPEKPLDRPL
jgi:DNA-binding transcriptional LysR family regulator